MHLRRVTLETTIILLKDIINVYVIELPREMFVANFTKKKVSYIFRQ